jgi:hypothetical protein
VTVLDFNPRKMREQSAAAEINAAIDSALTRKRANQERRDYIGASAIGHECERSIQFEYAGALREKDFPPETLRKFDMGHVGEELARAWFIDAGFKLVQKRQRTGERFRWVELDGQFSGEPDGVFIDGPQIPGLSYPAMWEHKFVGSKTYKAIAKDGLRKARPGYYGQTQLNMAYLGLTDAPTVFTVTNGDSGEQLHLLIAFDAEEAQRMSDRGARIVSATQAGELLPRPFQSSDFYVCKFCAFAQRCWSLPG